MRARMGWVAAVLLIAVAFLGGPDLLNDPPRAGTVAVTSIAERDQRADDDTGPRSWSPDRLLPGRRRVPGVPRSRPGDAGAARQAPLLTAADTAGPSRPAAAAGLRLRHGTCSPERLQVFRC